MENFNLLIIPLAAIVPLLIGAIWYNPAVFGKAWMKASGVTEEQTRSGNMIKIFGLTYLFGLLGAYMLSFAVVHQLSIVQLFFMDPALSDPNSEFSQFTQSYLNSYGDRHRSFGHGVIHGAENAFCLGLAFIGIPSLFERRPFKYVLIHLGYFSVTFAIMGGILCQFV